MKYKQIKEVTFYAVLWIVWIVCSDLVLRMENELSVSIKVMFGEIREAG